MNINGCAPNWCDANWKDCIHRWKRSREKWRAEAVKLQKQLCEMTRTAFHWRQQANIMKCEYCKTRDALAKWRAEAMRCRESTRQWKIEACRWREQARCWKQRCAELMDRKDDQMIAMMCQSRQRQCAQMQSMYPGC
ncbi:hypothetical protein BOX15_Mlig013763g1 [Macrostomum lignano]|uniref:Uncharacterized protein n=1 Tax=Macrostomum lignano TaxID=282301 RepID=A0A267DMI1_9PLAT|nr:hypothetical protein BOX15_Mlig013763g3 [Macrostomum lignano]PAA50520.1 hypothetical protein BOX15_Mlig013763g2 [Macrostomum lignano]PAA71911.1 hypothetical protein BOX15_Mlig013763g1 [Macrostomum lignano]